MIKTNLNKYCLSTRKAIRYALVIVKGSGYYSQNATDCEVFVNDFANNDYAKHLFIAAITDRLGDKRGYRLAKTLGF